MGDKWTTHGFTPECLTIGRFLSRIYLFGRVCLILAAESRKTPGRLWLGNVSIFLFLYLSRLQAVLISNIDIPRI